MSLPGALEQKETTDCLQKYKFTNVANDEIQNLTADAAAAASVSCLTNDNDEKQSPERDIECDVNTISHDLSLAEVLNFDLQAEATIRPENVPNHQITNVNVGETQLSATVIPSKSTNHQPPATNRTSLPEDQSLHAIVQYEEEENAAHNLICTNKPDETNDDNEIKAFRLRLNSENHIANRWQHKGLVNRSTVSVDRCFGTVPRNYGRRFGGSEDRDIPPHPLNTYQWEDVRRSREKVICCVFLFFLFVYVL